MGSGDCADSLVATVQCQYVTVYTATGNLELTVSKRTIRPSVGAFHGPYWAIPLNKHTPPVDECKFCQGGVFMECPWGGIRGMSMGGIQAMSRGCGTHKNH